MQYNRNFVLATCKLNVQSEIDTILGIQIGRSTIPDYPRFLIHANARVSFREYSLGDMKCAIHRLDVVINVISYFWNDFKGGKLGSQGVKKPC